MPHSEIGNDLLDLFAFMFESEEQPTVFDNEKYPQFLQFERTTKTITPIESTVTPCFKIGSWVKIIFDLFKHLFELAAKIVK